MSTTLRARLLAILALAALTGCGGDSTEPPPSEPTQNPLPVLLSAAPAQLILGTGAITVTLSGSGFITSSQARWNDGDRVTHYQNPQTLTVDLLASDLATLLTGTFTVVNGPPGGGVSGVVNVPVGYPVPTITSVTPNAIPVQSSGGSVPITITGTGFVAQSSVRLGNNFVAVTSQSPTQIVSNVSTFLLTTPGTLSLTVVNPTPGGGTSNSVQFSVTYPTPSITSLSPDSSFTGAAFTLTVNGTGFGSGSVVRWNGSDRPTTFVNTTRLTAAIPASDVANATVALVSVFNPTPGGGTSNAVSYRVREPAPFLTGINPGFVIAGAGTVTVSLTGTNFRPGATAQWNGQDRTSLLVSSTAMTITLNSSDVAAPQVGRLTVTNPGASGVSNSLSLAVVPAGASLSVSRVVTITHADLVHDDLRNVIYASVPSSASQNANSVVRIDPSSGAITGSVSVGSNPGILAITEDGQYLYVGLLGASRVVRITLSTFTRDIDISIPGDGFFGGRFAEDIVPIPGAPKTIAVSTFYTGVSPRNAGTYLFDDGTPRPATGPGHTGSNRLTHGPTGARIYGYNNETTEFGFRSLLVATTGLIEETVKAGLVGGFGVDIEYSGGFVYATTGEVVDPSTLQKLGTIPAFGVVRPDAANARVHFLNSGMIRTYHYTSFSSLGTFADQSLAGHTKLIRWGADGLAVGGGTSIVLLRGGLVAQ